jgi:diguanylate cyclase (GGDEF)-like protein/PAS domain S-box-containing protein
MSTNGNAPHPRRNQRLTKRAGAAKKQGATRQPGPAESVGQRRQASDRMEFMFESSPNGIIEADERGLVTNWNPQAEQIFGWSKGEMVGESLAQIITPRRYRKSHELGLEDFMASRPNLEPGQMFELAGLHKDGHEFPVELAVSAAMDSGAGATFVTYVRDLTTQKRGERLEALRVQVTEILAQAAGIDEMADLVLAAICDAFGWQVGEFWAVDRAADRLHQVATWHGSSRAVKTFISQGKRLEQARGVGLAGRVWESGAVVEVDDLATDAAFQRGASALSAGLSTGVGFPLMNGVEMAGVITFFWTAPYSVTADRLQIMESICTQICQFLERDESDHRIRAILEHVADGIVTMDVEGTIESFNRSARRLLGYSLQDAVGNSIDVLVERGRHDELVEYLANRLRPGKKAPISGTHETVGRRKDGSTFPMEFLATDMRLGGRRIFIATLRDITERKAQTDALEFQALHDSLTGLPNRTLLRDRMAREILAAAREKRSCGLLVLDMDQFKEVNDTLGHDYGDQLLQEFAGRISGALREVDTFARLGGDEFAVLPVGAGDMDGVVATATKILAALETPFVIDGTTLHARASIGIAVFPEDAADGGTLLRRADVAMYVAKESHSGYAVYSPEHEEHVGRRMALLGELRDRPTDPVGHQ